MFRLITFLWTWLYIIYLCIRCNRFRLESNENQCNFSKDLSETENKLKLKKFWMLPLISSSIKGIKAFNLIKATLRLSSRIPLCSNNKIFVWPSPYSAWSGYFLKEFRLCLRLKSKTGRNKTNVESRTERVRWRHHCCFFFFDEIKAVAWTIVVGPLLLPFAMWQGVLSRTRSVLYGKTLQPSVRADSGRIMDPDRVPQHLWHNNSLQLFVVQKMSASLNIFVEKNVEFAKFLY